jgi:hypothetical protein
MKDVKDFQDKYFPGKEDVDVGRVAIAEAMVRDIEENGVKEATGYDSCQFTEDLTKIHLSNDEKSS